MPEVTDQNHYHFNQQQLLHLFIILPIIITLVNFILNFNCFFVQK